MLRRERAVFCSTREAFCGELRTAIAKHAASEVFVLPRDFNELGESGKAAKRHRCPGANIRKRTGSSFLKISFMYRLSV